MHRATCAGCTGGTTRAALVGGTGAGTARAGAWEAGTWALKDRAAAWRLAGSRGRRSVDRSRAGLRHDDAALRYCGRCDCLGRRYGYVYGLRSRRGGGSCGCGWRRHRNRSRGGGRRGWRSLRTRGRGDDDGRRAGRTAEDAGLGRRRGVGTYGTRSGAGPLLCGGVRPADDGAGRTIAAGLRDRRLRDDACTLIRQRHDASRCRHGRLSGGCRRWGRGRRRRKLLLNRLRCWSRLGGGCCLGPGCRRWFRCRRGDGLRRCRQRRGWASRRRDGDRTICWRADDRHRTRRGGLSRLLSRSRGRAGAGCDRDRSTGTLSRDGRSHDGDRALRLRGLTL